MKKIKLVKAEHKDVRIMYEWSNDPTTRKNSFSMKPIPWDEHLEWMKKKLVDSNCLFFIGIDEGGNPIGSIRIDKEEGKGVISFCVAPDRRHQGFGEAMLAEIDNIIDPELDIDELIGKVKPDNIASICCFVNNGYIEKERDERKIVYAKKCP
ncbi:MAG: GNAT family N-acetyltransferase [Lachnospiraceae bacterium]|nr:GNAT family N-acetyltransferase [Lachnospiraceae bacterium]